MKGPTALYNKLFDADGTLLAEFSSERDAVTAMVRLDRPEFVPMEGLSVEYLAIEARALAVLAARQVDPFE